MNFKYFLAAIFVLLCWGCQSPTQQTAPPPILTSTLAPATVTTRPTVVPVYQITIDDPTLLDVFTGSTDCRAPCWNRLIPGKSSPSDVIDFFARLGIDVSEEEPFKTSNNTFVLDSLNVILKTPSASLSLLAVEWVNEKVISVGLFFGSTYPEFLDFKMIFNDFGTPDLILVDLTYDGMGKLYKLRMDFSDKNTTIHYLGRPMDGFACLNQEDYERIEVFLYAEAHDPGEFIHHVDEYQEIKDIAKITEQDFVDSINQNQCVQLEVN